jgi:hypothetical protein
MRKRQTEDSSLKRLLETNQVRDLYWRHKVGRLVKKLYPKEEKRRYGETVMVNLAESLGYDEVRAPRVATRLWYLRAFALAYPCRADVDQLVKDGLTWSHVRYLLSVHEKTQEDEKRVRDKLQSQAVKHQWTSGRLHEAVKERYARDTSPANDHRGRPEKELPDEPAEMLRELIQRTYSWLRLGERLLDEKVGKFVKESRKPQPSAVRLQVTAIVGLKRVVQLSGSGLLLIQQWRSLSEKNGSHKNPKQPVQENGHAKQSAKNRRSPKAGAPRGTARRRR